MVEVCCRSICVIIQCLNMPSLAIIRVMSGCNPASSSSSSSSSLSSCSSSLSSSSSSRSISSSSSLRSSDRKGVLVRCDVSVSLQI